MALPEMGSSPSGLRIVKPSTTLGGWATCPPEPKTCQGTRIWLTCGGQEDERVRGCEVRK